MLLAPTSDRPDAARLVDDDTTLLTRLRSGDIDAFAELYRRHEPAARRYARRLAAHHADDVVAEAFTASLAAIDRGFGPVDQFRPYLFTAVRRHAARALARAGIGAPADGVEPAEELDQLERIEHRDSPVVGAFARIPDRWRHILFLVEVEGRPISEVAAHLDLSPSAASALLYRARRGLRASYLDLTGATDVRGAG